MTIDNSQHSFRAPAGMPDGEWETPDWLFWAWDRTYKFDLDVAATAENTKCQRSFSKELDALTQDWGPGNVWMNPPYGRNIHLWVKKAAETVENSDDYPVIVGLLPASTDTKWWFDYVVNRAADITFLTGRVKFEGKAKWIASFPSAVVVWTKLFAEATPIIRWVTIDELKESYNDRREDS